MRAKILIVDDDSAIRQMVCLALAQANYNCLEAADAVEAQASIVADKPDLILLDWMLPKGSGIELAARPRGRGPAGARRAARRRSAGAGPGADARPDHASRQRRRPEPGAGPDGIPPAALLHDPF